jgi:hypothetical protein
VELQLPPGDCLFFGIEKIMVTRPESGALKKICSRHANNQVSEMIENHQYLKQLQ